MYRFVARNAPAQPNAVILSEERSEESKDPYRQNTPTLQSSAASSAVIPSEVEGPAVSSRADAASVRNASSSVIPSAAEGPAVSPAARKIQRKLHQTIKRITDDFGGRWHFNTSIAAIMELVNELYAYEDAVQKGEPAATPQTMADMQRDLTLMLAPFAPYLAHELWEMLGQTSELLRAPWPKYDPELAKEEEVEIAVQVSGKIKARITVPADADEEAVRSLALADEKIKAAIEGKEIVKVLVVKGRLVNIVVK